MSSAEEDVAAVIREDNGHRNEGNRRVVTFGEGLVRLAVLGHERLERAATMDVTVSGPELGTAVALASMGIPASWVSSVPDVPLGRMVLRTARQNGVDVSHVKRQPGKDQRVGLAFVEAAPDPRPSTVLYDVAGSSMASLKSGTFDWTSVLDGAVALHLSGVTLGLSSGVRSEAMAAVQVANRLGVLVSFDLTHRPESWGEADARQAFVEIIHHVDVLFASRGGLRAFFGIEGPYESVLRQAIEKLGVAAVAMNRKRAKGSRRVHIESMAMGKSGVLATSGSRDIEVVDRLGAGDAFAAGFIAGYLENPIGLSRPVSLAAAACALKHTMPGEFLCATRDEVEALAAAGA